MSIQEGGHLEELPGRVSNRCFGAIQGLAKPARSIPHIVSKNKQKTKKTWEQVFSIN